MTPCGWKQAQTTGGGLLLDEVEDDFQFKGCPGLYFVGETLDCAGSCGGYNLHWAFGSGIIAGRAAASFAKEVNQQAPEGHLSGGLLFVLFVCGLLQLRFSAAASASSSF